MWAFRVYGFALALLLPMLASARTGAVDASTLDGKILCGYQGWFACPGDGAGRGWVHWTKGAWPMAAGNAGVDLWPDVSELGPGERFATGFKHPDGSAAEVFSSFNKTTVLRHFEWMRTYGIDGAFVQRFASELGDPAALKHRDAVLAHCRDGAVRSGRTFCVMYDLSGLKAGETRRVIDDWRTLRTRMKITENAAYQRHRGRPLVAVWGVGFSDGRAYTLGECRTLVEALKADGCAVMLGVPTYWRTLDRDAVADPVLLQIIKSADVVSPWTVGRYDSPEAAAAYATDVMAADVAWCRDATVDYLPVVFPGFSWHHLKDDAPLGQIPRLKGQFLWSQLLGVRSARARSAYVAMFDEVDEGTAVFKCSDAPPAGFLDLEGLPSDFYLKLVGAGGKLLRGELPTTAGVPAEVHE